MSRSPEELRQIVAEMRALGVVEFDGVRLGPVPVSVPVARIEREPSAKDVARSRMRMALRSSGGDVSDAWFDRYWSASHTTDDDEVA